MFIRYLIVWLLIVFTGYSTFGQAILVTKASEYLKKNELASAREAIDLAAKNEATQNDPQTCYVRGFIYKELFKANPTVLTHRETALTSLQKCDELDKNGAYKPKTAPVLDYLYGSFYNEGVEYLNKKDFAKALASFKPFIEYRTKTKPDDYLAEAYFNAGYAALALKDTPLSRGYYEKALQLNYNNPLLYDDLAQIYQQLGEKKLAIQTVEAGRQKFPNDANLRISQINLSLYLKDYPKAEKQLEEYMRIDPTNIDVMMVAGTVYESLAREDSAKRKVYFEKRKMIYQKILQKSPEDPSANYNMAVTLYNKAVDLLGVDVYSLEIQDYNKHLDEITKIFNEALPFAEKAVQMEPKNRNALKALQGIYHFLNRRDESRKIGARLDQLKG